MSTPQTPPLLPEAEERFVTLPDDLRICYRCFGDPRGEPLLLIAGLGLQLISWPASFIDALVAAGHFVIAPDNRDAGRSSGVSTPPPGRLRQLLAWPHASNYGLDDMANDMVLLLQHLNVARAHVVGMSMGGMVGQTMASRYPSTVLSLCSIFSTTGAPGVGRPELSTMLKMTKSAPRSMDEAVSRHAAMMKHIGDGTVPGIAEVWADYAQRAWVRNGCRANSRGTARQIAAIQKSGDRTAQLKRVKAPTLVLHGDLDRIVAPSGGAATAKAIPGARLITIAGMRHQIDNRVSGELTAHICAHIRKAGSSRQQNLQPPTEPARCN